MKIYIVFIFIIITSCSANRTYDDKIPAPWTSIMKSLSGISK